MRFNTDEDEVGAILISRGTWDKIKTELPPPIKSLFPTMCFMNEIPVKISPFVLDGQIILLPRKLTDMCKKLKFHSPEFKVRIEPLYIY